MSTEVHVGEPKSAGPTAVGVRGAQRVIELDILRGLAILLVLGMHSPSSNSPSGPFRPIDVAIHRFGWTGVDLFFVLSGFLVGGLLFTELERRGNVAFRRFAMRRILRLWPMYYLFLAYVYIRMVIESHGEFGGSLGREWPALLHIQNYIELRPQLWSLAVEEHFYLALPIFLCLLIRKRPAAESLRIIPFVCAGLIVGSLAIRTGLAGATHMYVGRQSYVRMDAMFFGVTIAYYRMHRPLVLERIAKFPWLVPLAILCMLPALGPNLMVVTIGYTGLFIGYGLLMVRLLYPEYRIRPLNVAVRSRSARIMAWIGTYSFSIYLWHYDLGWQGYLGGRRLGEKLGLPDPLIWLLHTTTWFVAAVVSGALIGMLFEVPLMRFRERFFPPTVIGNAAVTGDRQTTTNTVRKPRLPLTGVDPATIT